MRQNDADHPRPTPSRREAKASSVPRSLGRSRVTGPAVVLTVVGQWAVAAASPGPLAALVALPAEELGDLSLDGDLHQQAHPQPGDLLQNLAERALGGEQVINLS